MTSLAVERAPDPGAQPRQISRILVVDDEDTIRLVLTKYLKTRGFEVASAPSGDAALELLGDQRFDLMLCDVRMPGLSGVEVVPSALEIDPDLAIVMLSAVNDAATATAALTDGVLDYLTKPIELQELHRAVLRALDKREDRRVRRASSAVDVRIDGDIERERSTWRAGVMSMLEHLVDATEGKHALFHGHSARVAELARAIATALRLSPDVVEEVCSAARLHDVGNVAVRDDVLLKPGKLSVEELDHLQDHVRVGVEMLRPLGFMERVVSYVGDHHEHWDGTGYPNGRAGADISVGGRIVAAAEIFDALTSRRSYRDALPRDEAIEVMRGLAGSVIDPQVCEAVGAVARGR
jgi:putative two-component system response regulator